MKRPLDEEGSLAQATLYERVRQRTAVAVTERDVERVLTALYAAGSAPEGGAPDAGAGAGADVDVWTLMGACDVPLVALPALLEELERDGLLVRRGDRLALTPKGLRIVEERGWAPSSPRQLRCPACRGRGLDLGAEPFKGLLKRFREVVRGRPEPQQAYDQGYVTPETTIARLALMRRRGDLAGKRLIVLGDDDLLGLAAALEGSARRIVVLELDPQLVAFMERARERWGLTSLEIHRHDLRDPLPDELVGAFDTFATEPIESLPGLLLFLSRGLCALRGRGSAGHFGLTRHEASPEKWLKLQRWLTARGACITDCLDRFNEYLNWPYWEAMRARRWLRIESPPQSVWYRSTQIRLELVEPQAYPNEPYRGALEDEELATT